MSTDDFTAGRGELEEADLLAIIEYLDGEMPPDEMIEFELRLSEDPALETAFESFESTDRLQRRALSRKAPWSKLRLLPRWRVLDLAAAAALLLMIGAYFMFLRPSDQKHGLPTSDAIEFDVAALSTGVGVAGFHRALGLVGPEADVRPESWKQALRGADDPGQFTILPDAEYYRDMAPVLETRLERALADPSPLDPIEYFVLPLRVEQELSALVLLVDSQGVVSGALGEPFEAAYPGGASWDQDSGRLQSGRVHVLPQEMLRWEGEPGDKLQDFEWGFLVPRGARQLTVLVALRSAAFDDGLRASLVEFLASLAGQPRDATRTLAQLQSWLGEQSFEVEQILLDEKK